MINLECDEDLCTQRILERSKNSGRSDDNLEAIKKRFNTFQKESVIVVEAMKQYTNVVTVNSDKGPDEIFAEVCGNVECLNNLNL